jgi:hypothetical protein
MDRAHTRARAKAIKQEVNSVLYMRDLDTPWMVNYVMLILYVSSGMSDKKHPVEAKPMKKKKNNKNKNKRMRKRGCQFWKN